MPGEVGRLANLDHLVDEHADVEARPAQVGGDDVLQPERLRQHLRAGQAADRPRDHRLVEPRVLPVDGAAVGEQREQAPVVPVGVRRVLDALEHGARLLGRVGLEHEALRAVVLPHHGRDLV